MRKERKKKEIFFFLLSKFKKKKIWKNERRTARTAGFGGSRPLLRRGHFPQHQHDALRPARASDGHIFEGLHYLRNGSAVLPDDARADRPAHSHQGHRDAER